MGFPNKSQRSKPFNLINKHEQITTRNTFYHWSTFKTIGELITIDLMGRHDGCRC